MRYILSILYILFNFVMDKNNVKIRGKDLNKRV